MFLCFEILTIAFADPGFNRDTCMKSAHAFCCRDTDVCVLCRHHGRGAARGRLPLSIQHLPPRPLVIDHDRGAVSVFAQLCAFVHMFHLHLNCELSTVLTRWFSSECLCNFDFRIRMLRTRIHDEGRQKLELGDRANAVCRDLWVHVTVLNRNHQRKSIRS